MSDYGKISVIMPAYNSAAFINDSIRSVLSQSYSNWELIVIDNGSTDNTEEIVNSISISDKRIIFLKTDKKGVSCARNLGLSKATGEWITFLDSDDMLEPNALEAMISKSSDADLVVADYRMNHPLSKTHVWIEKDIYYQDISELKELVVGKLWVFTYTVWGCLFRKSSIKETFNEKYKFGEDTLFMARFLSQMKPLKLIRDVVYFYRTGNPQSLSQKLNDANLNVFVEIVDTYLTIYSDNDSRTNLYSYYLQFICAKIDSIANNPSLSYEEKSKQITQILESKRPKDLEVGRFSFSKDLQRRANLLLIGDVDLLLSNYGLNNKSDKHNFYPELRGTQRWCGLDDEDKKKVRRISFWSELPPLNNLKYSYSWDVSKLGNHSITLYLFPNMDEILVVGNGSSKIKASSSMNKMFADFENLEEIEGLDLIDTSDVEDMSYLFYHCCSLKKLDLSSWDVSKVKNFRATFCLGHNQVGDAKIREINLKGWNTSSAEDMAYMFYGCGHLKHLDVSSFDTSNVTNFRHTFADCFSLRELDVSKWNTSRVKTLDGMFNDCRSIKQFDVSKWDTSNVEEFDQLFDNCKSLKEIKGLDKLNTSSCFSFEEMFFGCKSLRRLDLSSIDTRKVDGHSFVAFNSSIESTSNMNRILDGCDNLRHLKVGNNLVIPAFDKSSNKILEGLNDNGYVVVTPMSSSMWPLLRKKKDQAVFKEVDKYRKNDVVLYKSDFSSDLVMHRIKRELSNGYIIKGDKALNSEFVFKEYVFAKAIEIYRKNENIKSDSIKFKILSFLSITYDYFYLRYRRYKKHHKK